MSEHANAPLAASDLTQRVVTLISETQEIPIENILLDVPFEKIGLTSLNAMSIVFEIENEFGISIRDDEAAKITNVRQVVEKLREILSMQAKQAAAARN